MRAAYVDSVGHQSPIRYGELQDPRPSAGQAIVQVDVVAVNTVDTLLRSGRWRTEVRFPQVLGRDLVGTVVAVGPQSTGPEVGRRVWTNSAGYGGRAGATSELVPVDQDRLYPLPADADPQQFVAAVHPGATAYGVLIERARLQVGETVAIVGANGAVGMCLVQVAAAHGAEPIAVVRDPRSTTTLRGLGAAEVVVADAESAAEAAASAAAAGVDVLVDTSGQIDVGRVPARLNPRGRMVLIAGRDRRWSLDPWTLYTREIALLGFVMSAMEVGELARAAEWINNRHVAGPLNVGVGEVLRFADAEQAYGDVERGRLPRLPDGTVGRMLLRP